MLMHVKDKGASTERSLKIYYNDAHMWSIICSNPSRWDNTQHISSNWLRTPKKTNCKGKGVP
jgi:hypothetical protein